MAYEWKLNCLQVSQTACNEIRAPSIHERMNYEQASSSRVARSFSAGFNFTSFEQPLFPKIHEVYKNL